MSEQNVNPPLPEWREANIEEVAEVNPSGKAVSVADDTEVTFLPMAAVEELTGNIDSSVRKLFGEVKKGYTRFRDGDVLFAKITPSMENGKVAVVRGLRNGIGCGSTEFHVLRPREGLDADYLRYFLVQSAFRQDAQRNMRGAVGQLRVPPAYMREAKIPVAPRDQQTEIVAKIDELFSQIDEGERALARVQKLVERYRQSLLKAAITGELTRDWRETNASNGQPPGESGEQLLQRILKARREAWVNSELEQMAAKSKQPKNDDWKKKYKLPEYKLSADLPDLPAGWAWSTLGQLFDVFVGGTPSRKEANYWSGYINWVSSGEVAFCRISETRETITELGLQKSAVRLHPPGTVLLAMIGEGKTRGQAAILDITAGHNQNAASIRVGDTPIPPEYIFWLLKFRYEAVRAMGQGGNQPALNGGLVKEIPVPLPPVAEAVEICERLEVSEAAIQAASDEVQRVGEKASALRQSVLNAAFSGVLNIATKSVAA
ncbi:restriction endonuclease subunit S [Spectribacter hydrogenooxidans]|uniref:Restriction endonuclease subunit S n=1 Tax=Spectribacter hydrogenoxidans TaxID=3075608 RepID=A0ABU3BY31_9GAMM|nr:restriction endonuclease subunit S [Salinisphaera sp. W335]MDT0634214.1 restriction endonuclease subunit S [Salinisphaera sp. W335]